MNPFAGFVWANFIECCGITQYILDSIYLDSPKAAEDWAAEQERADTGFQADQRQRYLDQLALDCSDELPGPGDLRDIRDDGLFGPYDEEF